MEGLAPLLQNITGGLLIGGIYALIGVGLSLIFGVMRVINFAHGEFVAIGMYLAIVLFRQLGIDPYLTLFIALPTGLILGVLIQRLVLARLVDSPVPNWTRPLDTMSRVEICSATRAGWLKPGSTGGVDGKRRAMRTPPHPLNTQAASRPATQEISL